MESEKINRVTQRRVQLALVLASTLGTLSFAQSPDQTVQSEPTVQWTAAVIRPTAAGNNDDASLELSAQVLAGWHVYAPTQPSGGPTALRVTIDQNDFVQVAGVPTGTKPRSRHDPSFDLETQIYTHSFAVHVPLRLLQARGIGTGEIPVSVRFQSCSDRECRPPRTVHLFVPIELLPDT
jgi:Disulphide bond corrector protein DsbC